MWLDELVGLFGADPFTLKRGKRYKNWTLSVSGKIFKARDGLELLKKVEAWRDDRQRQRARGKRWVVSSSGTGEYFQIEKEEKLNE